MEKEVGIVKGYPRISRRFGKLAAWFQLLRPFTLVAPFVAGLLGTLTPVKNSSFHEFTVAVYVGVSLALAQASGQAINQAMDADLDRQLPSKSHRPVARGLIKKEEALGIGWLLALFAIARAFTLNTFFGIVTLSLVFFAVYYSMAPLSPRRLNPFLNTAWMGFSRGFLPVFAVLSIYGKVEDALPWAVFAFLWCLSLQGTKDVSDREVDKKFGVKTIPNTYGLKGFLAYSASLTVAMYVYASFYTPILFCLIPISVIALLGLNKTVKGMENNLSWICFYLGISAIYLLMFLSSRL